MWGLSCERGRAGFTAQTLYFGDASLAHIEPRRVQVKEAYTNQPHIPNATPPQGLSWSTRSHMVLAGSTGRTCAAATERAYISYCGPLWLGGSASSKAGGRGGAFGLAGLRLPSWSTGGSGAPAPGPPSEGGGGMLLLLPSSLGALLLGVLLSLGGSGLGIALSEAEEEGSDEGGGADWGLDVGSVEASSGKTLGHVHD